MGKEMLSTKKWILLLGGVFVILCALAAASFAGGQPGEGAVARIYQNDELLRSVSLTETGEAQEFTVSDGTHENTIRIDERGICVVSANCPDQYCVEQGYLKSGALPIVCLPHRLVIELDGAQADGADISVG